MCVILFPLWSLATYFTNWTMLATLSCLFFSMLCASTKGIEQRKGRLAALHLLTEVAFLLNLVTVTVYWSVIHAATIH